MHLMYPKLQPGAILGTLSEIIDSCLEVVPEKYCLWEMEVLFSSSEIPFINLKSKQHFLFYLFFLFISRNINLYKLSAIVYNPQVVRMKL